MKIFKKVLILTLFLLVVILNGCKETSTDQISQEEQKISLNLQQADLIAKFTDNEKYLNKDLLYDISKLEDDDNISIIVTMNENALSKLYNEDDKGYRSLTEYANSDEGTRLANLLKEEQQILANELIDKKYINSKNHNYVTLLNGFSAQTTYGQFKKLLKSGYNVKVTISEVYSMPEVQTLSTYNSSGENGESSYDAVVNQVKVYETGIFDSSGVGYDGNNTSVAILDSGFDIHHTVFQNMPDQPMLSRDYIEGLLVDSKAYGYDTSIKVQDVYVNAKIPFAYDYADKDTDVAAYDSNHGTHVAGIIAGKDDVITGVAVNTQLVLMKVFGDTNNGAVQEDILAALEDAILIGVDAINLSLGTSCGFARESDKEYVNEVYDRIEESGISLVVAASNDYSSGYGGENSNTNKASNPDSATVGSPGTYASTISVASISGLKSKYIITEDGYTFFFNNANDNSGEPYDFYDMLFSKLESNQEEIVLEYVTVPGVGKNVNYSGIDVKGKIALVKRGDTSFEEKAKVALAHGALACIIYNNIAGDVFMNAGAGLELPLCSLSKDDGEYLASKGTGKLVLNKKYLAGPFMSAFSSWGPVSNLSLKPEITAHGGSILSSVPGGGYEEVSGTSMACPNMCGVIILVRQALKERYPDMDAKDLIYMSNQLLMSTATIILDEQGNPYSPRKQGSGLGNLEYALDTLAYISVEGTTKTKLELLDDPEETGVYKLVFTINNLSNTTNLQYKLTNLTMTESLSTADPEYVAEEAYMLNPHTEAKVTGNGNLNGDIITIDASGKVEVTYTIKLTEEAKDYIRKSFINGIYVEGFAVLESLNEDQIDLSVPFLSFFGDWTQAPMFDKTYYEVESEAHNGSIDEEDKLKADYYASTPLGTYYYSYVIPLGSYVYEMDENIYDPIPASEEHAAIGYNLETINGITTVYAGLLRNAKKMTTIIKNTETGDVVYEHVKYDEHKAYFGGSIIPGYDLINITAIDLGLQNNTQYTFSMLAELDYGDGGIQNNLNNTFEFSFYVDFQAPVITNAEFYSKFDKVLNKNRYYVDISVYDNHYVQSIRPFTLIDGEISILSEYVTPVYSEKNSINKVTMEITDYMDLLQYSSLTDEDGNVFDLTNGLGFLVDDYALNQAYTYVTLPGTNTSNISYKEEYYSSNNNGTYQYKSDLYIGDELDLTYMLTSDDQTLPSDPEVASKYFSTLKWESTDESVIKVHRGQIEAVGIGTAMIKCTTLTTTGEPYTINLKIRVRERRKSQEKASKASSNTVEDIKFTYFDVIKAFVPGPDPSEIGETGDKIFFTEKPNISCYPGEVVKINYEITPWNLKNTKLVWKSTNEKVATIEEDGTVRALKEGSTTITLQLEIDGRLSSLMASTIVNVKNEFIIEGNTLVAYKGLGGDVVIPDDEGILYIGSYAFSLYTTDYEIEIPEDDYDIAKTPDYNDTIKSVTIPAIVKEVQKYAFYRCTALEKVTFLKNEEGVSCPFIKEFAFFGNENLTDINLSDIDLIGSCAFEGCTKLKDIDLSNTYAIGSYAFKDCQELIYADLTSLRNAGTGIFINCQKLTKIDNGIYTNFSTRMFENSGLETLEFNAKKIPNNCFENCNNLTTVIINNDISYIGKEAFLGCGNLKEVHFKEGVASELILEKAFKNCTLLSKITLPDSQFEFENDVFDNCQSLEEVKFQQYTEITDNLGNLFTSCNNLSTFNVDSLNENYYAVSNLLLSKDGTTIILATPNYEYGDYILSDDITKIADGAFSSIEKITALTTNNVKEIGSNAFEYCPNLKTLTISLNGIIINEKAFKDSGLELINNIEYLNEINEYTFSNTKLQTLTLNNVVIQEGAFAGSSLQTIDLTLDSIASYAFSGCEFLETATLNTPLIGNYAFKDCLKLTNLTLNNVISLGDGTFLNCSSLKTLDNDTIQTIGNYGFSNCINLESINLPNIKTIGECAFSTMELLEKQTTANNLTTLTFGDSLESIGDYAFRFSNSLKTVTIGSNIYKLGKFAFSNCQMLEKFETTGSINTLEEATFNVNPVLKTVIINNLQYINDGVFFDCQALEEIDLSNVIEIGVQAFYNCLSLKEANLEKVIKLADGAFLGATSLTVLNMPVVEEIHIQALSNIGVSEIIIPKTIKFIASTAFAYNVNQTKFIDSSNSDTAIINDYALLDHGVLYTITDNNKYLLTSYPTAKEDSEYTVLFNTVRIDEFAGYNNPYITKLIFPDTLELIGNMCFYGATKLNTIEFKSTTAPTLEGTVGDLHYEYDTDTEIYQFLNKYFQFNGYYPLYYAQFKDLIGKTTKLNIIVPANEDLKGYDDVVYNLYFNLDKLQKSNYIALNDYSIDYLTKVALIPDHITLSDEDKIIAARTAFNLINQDLTNYGYTKEYLDELEAKLTNAEKVWKEMNDIRINKAYGHIIALINALGSEYQFDKIKDYYEVAKLIDLISRDDLKYIDKTNVDEFKKGLDAYFKDLNEDVNILIDATTLSTSKVNKVGMTLIAANSLLVIVLAVILLRKRWL